MDTLILVHQPLNTPPGEPKGILKHVFLLRRKHTLFFISSEYDSLLRDQFQLSQMALVVQIIQLDEPFGFVWVTSFAHILEPIKHLVYGFQFINHCPGFRLGHEDRITTNLSSGILNLIL